MSQYTIYFAKQAMKDVQQLDQKSRDKLQKILRSVISENPYTGKKLVGSLQGNYSYRLNIKDRIVYSINDEERCVYIKRVRTHYGE